MPSKSGLLEKSLFLVLPLVLGTELSVSAQTRIEDTPSLIQEGFGPGGFDLSGDGSSYCGPTTANIMVGYLAKQGFTQLLPANATDADYLNLERILVGMSFAGFSSGSSWTDVANAITMYANARGISTIQATYMYQPDLAYFASAQTNPLAATALNIQWMQRSTESGNYYNDVGGHFVAVSGVSVEGNTLTLSNPAPSALFNVPDVPNSNPQPAEVIPFTGDSTFGAGFLQFDYHQANSALVNTKSGVLALIDDGYTVSIDASDLNVEGWTAATWTLTGGTNKLWFNGSTFDVTAPLAGSVGINKAGSGTVVLHGSNSTTGENQISAGTIVSTSNSATPLGTGSIVMGQGTLKLAPDDSTPSAVVQHLAGGTGHFLTFNGAAVLSLDQGNNTSLDLDIGHAAQTKEQSFHRSGSGTFVLQLANGLSNLGTSTLVHVLGTGNLTHENGILRPFIIGADTDWSGSFLAHGASGLVQATYSPSSAVGINDAVATDVYDTVTNQVVAANGTAAVYALRVGTGVEISGADAASELQVGSQASGASTGVILNHGAEISVANLQFGDADALMYTAGADNVVSSQITANSLTKFGPGDLHLSGQANLSGSLNVQSGTLHLEGTTPTGFAPVEVATATLVVHSGVVVQGSINSVGGKVVLDGGTVNAVTTDINSEFIGGGTIKGSANLSGQVNAVTHELIFESDVSLTGDSMLVFTLGALKDMNTGVAGVDWSLYTFDLGAGETLSLDGFVFENDFNLIASTLPNGDNDFWKADHTWLLMRSTVSLDNIDDTWGFPAYEHGYFEWNTDTESGPYANVLYMNYYANPVPEPRTWVLLGLGVFLIFVDRRRRMVRT